MKPRDEMIIILPIPEELGEEISVTVRWTNESGDYRSSWPDGDYIEIYEIEPTVPNESVSAWILGNWEKCCEDAGLKIEEAWER